MSGTKDLSQTARRISTSFLTDSGGTYVFTQGYTLYEMKRTRTTGPGIRHWKALAALGLDATTSLQGSEEKIQFGNRELSHNYVLWGPTGTDQIGVIGTGYTRKTEVPVHVVLQGGDPSELSEAQAYAAALGRFNQKAHAVSTKFEGGSFLGELRETIHGITHPADALAKGITSYLKVAKKLRANARKIVRSSNNLGSKQAKNAIKNANKALAGTWLEYTFGWTPLLSDIKDAVEAYGTKYSSRSPFEMVVASASEKAPYSHSEATKGDGPLTWTEVTRVSTETSVTFRGVVTVQFASTPGPSLELYGFNPRNFVPSVWEVVPYSWLVDYFTNIGDIIAGISYGGFNVRWAAVTVRKQYLTENWAVLKSIDSGTPNVLTHSGSLSGGLTRSWRKVVSRGTYHGNYIPMPIFHVPTSVRRWGNMVSVAAQLLDRFI